MTWDWNLNKWLGIERMTWYWSLSTRYVTRDWRMTWDWSLKMWLGIEGWLEIEVWRNDLELKEWLEIEMMTWYWRLKEWLEIERMIWDWSLKEWRRVEGITWDRKHDLKFEGMTGEWGLKELLGIERMTWDWRDYFHIWFSLSSGRKKVHMPAWQKVHIDWPSMCFMFDWWWFRRKNKKLTWTFTAVWVSVIIAVWLLLIGLPDATLQVCSFCQPHMLHEAQMESAVRVHLSLSCTFLNHKLSNWLDQHNIFLWETSLHLPGTRFIFNIGLSYISFYFLFLVHESSLKSCTSHHVKIASKNCTWDWRYVQSRYNCGHAVFIVRQLLCV